MASALSAMGLAATALPASAADVAPTTTSAPPTTASASPTSGSPSSPGPGVAAGRLGGSIDAGAAHTCAIAADGTARCWGDDTYQQSTVPAGLGTVSAVTAGGAHSCAIKTSGDPVCWGTLIAGYATPPGSVIAISAGKGFACAIRSDSTPECWGAASLGETTLPVGIGTVQAISAGYNHACAIKTDGTTVCWGDNSAGETTIPVGLGTVTAISAGTQFTCAIKTNGTPACWGANGNGQATIPAGLGTVTAIDAGAFHACAIKADASAACWGSNGNGQTTIPPASLSSVTMITAGAQHTCAVTSAGTSVCWGNNGSGRATPTPGMGSLNRPTVVTSTMQTDLWVKSCGIRADSWISCWGYNPYFTAAPPVDPATSISLGVAHGCAVLRSGLPQCWGWFPDPIPNGVGTVRTISTVESYIGTSDACAIKTDGTLVCWGDNTHGQITIPAGLGTVTGVATAARETCAITTAGTPACWGTNATTYPIPANIGPIRTIALNEYGGCAIKVNGTLVCWGAANQSQLVVPANLGTVTSVALGAFETCALKTDATTVCFGGGTAASGSLVSVSPSDGFWCGVTPSWVPVCGGTNGAHQLDLGVALGPTLLLGNNVPVSYYLRDGSMADSFTATGTLPPGMSLTGNGVFAGTPTHNGVFTFSVSALLNGVVLQTKTLTITVTFLVTQTTDEVDTAIGDGLCATASGTCSLRAAIQEANADPGQDTIRFSQNGAYVLTRQGMFENAAATGDLDITDDLVISGTNTYIDAAGIDRVFQLVGTPTVTMDSLWIHGGALADGYGDGAGILVSGGSLTLSHGSLYSNTGRSWGGGVHVAAGGALTATQQSFGGNSAGIGGAVSGAANSKITVQGSSVNANTAAFGGGISSAGNVTLTGVNVTNNTAVASGGGLWTTGTLVVTAGSVNNNTAADYGGGIGAQGWSIISKAAIRKNTAKYGGGVAIAGTATISKSLIDGNHPTAGGYGTEVFNLGALTINTAQIDASASTMASAIYNGGSTWGRTATLTINDGTIASVGRGATIRNDTGGGAVTLTNTIVEASVDPAYPANPHGACGGAITSGGYNLVSDASCAFTQTGDAQNVATQLGPLTYTATLQGRFPGPPAVGTGKPGCSGTDYRLLSRPQSGACDKGSIDV